jgi:hypothetical protein
LKLNNEHPQHNTARNRTQPAQSVSASNQKEESHQLEMNHITPTNQKKTSQATEQEEAATSMNQKKISQATEQEEATTQQRARMTQRKLS